MHRDLDIPLWNTKTPTPAFLSSLYFSIVHPISPVIMWLSRSKKSCSQFGNGGCFSDAWRVRLAQIELSISSICAVVTLLIQIGAEVLEAAFLAFTKCLQSAKTENTRWVPSKWSPLNCRRSLEPEINSLCKAFKLEAHPPIRFHFSPLLGTCFSLLRIAISQMLPPTASRPTDGLPLQFSQNSSTPVLMMLYDSKIICYHVAENFLFDSTRPSIKRMSRSRPTPVINP